MVEWIASDAPVPYPDAVRWMEARAEAVTQGQAP
jgi:lipoyl(octanoyl) transferase